MNLFQLILNLLFIAVIFITTIYQSNINDQQVVVNHEILRVFELQKDINEENVEALQIIHDALKDSPFEPAGGWQHDIR